MFGASLGSLSLKDLKVAEGQQAKERPYAGTEDLYRQRWTWDRVMWGSHCIDCYPGNCPFRVYVKDGIVWREEPSGTLPVIEDGVPDMNPMGCQKGAGWSQTLYGKERILHPLKRVGERGEGKWKRVSWDEALTEVADAVIDAIQELGPESVIALSGCNMGTWGVSGRGRFFELIGGITTDLNAEMNDFAAGHYLTWGKFDPVSSIDDWFHSELAIIWFANPAYTRIPHYHYVLEARYRGAEVVTIAPDFSPSSIHSDYHVPVKPGSDAAFALAMCQVVVEEGLYNAEFVKEQTDLPLLVRIDSRRLLRGSDVEEGGRDDQFYLYDAELQRVAEAPRGTLALDGVDPALEGSFSATLKDGKQVEVVPVFELVKERLQDYTPERASELCGVHPETIRSLARKVAAKRTNIICGLNNASKFYHGDLIERSELLLLGLTGNWGRKGTGVRSWLGALFDGWLLSIAKRQGGQEETAQMLAAQKQMIQAMKDTDPTFTEELASIELAKQMASAGGVGMVPPVFLWYYHAGFREVWNKDGWNDPSMPRPFDEYFQEALSSGWWGGLIRPGPDTPPRVFIECGGNALRRTRGGPGMLLKHLWPKLKMVCTLDYRMSTTAAFSDIFLPIASQYEKIGFGIPSTHTVNLTFCDKVVEPAGESKTEWQIFILLAQKVQERAKARGVGEYRDGRGMTRRLDNAGDVFTIGGSYTDEEKVADEMLRDSVLAGGLPEGSSLDRIREKGFIRFVGLGVAARAWGQAAEIKPDETFTPFRWHVEKKLPYPTLTRRAQFYIDHDWFLEVGEQLPMHKDPPRMGGDYPFTLNSGHNRWSIHSLNIANRLMLETHRGRPHVVINDEDAQELGIEDNEEVRVFNDMGSAIVPAKISPAARPGQVIIYNGWEPYQFREWQDASSLEPGMVKWLHLAGGYGHLRYWPTEWQPCPVDRATRVGVAKLD